jgi:hypothetical protein
MVINAFIVDKLHNSDEMESKDMSKKVKSSPLTFLEYLEHIYDNELLHHLRKQNSL